MFQRLNRRIRPGRHGCGKQTEKLAEWISLELSRIERALAAADVRR
jgi:hypothetical protein